MKESILDVLLYLFEHYFKKTRTRSATATPSRTACSSRFSPAEISKASTGSTPRRPGPPAAVARKDGPTRIYFGRSGQARHRCRGFLLFLEQHGVLDADQRELVLDRAMALDQDELDLDDLKWVVLMVLFNQPGSEAAYAWMETQMFVDEPEPVH